MDTDVATPDQTDMAAGSNQPPLFPEDGGNDNGLAQQLTTMAPEELAAMAAALDPDVKMNLAQAIFSTMTPEQKQQLDTTPSGDVNDAMQNATPEKPEAMYQMSVIRAQKKCAATPGMETLALDHLDKWNQRLTSLVEDGYLDETETAKHRKALDKEGENRFSIVLTGHGLLHDTCVAIEALEKSRACNATLSRSVLQGAQGRFSASRPVVRQPDKNEELNVKEAEEAGARLARYS